MTHSAVHFNLPGGPHDLNEIIYRNILLHF